MNTYAILACSIASVIALGALATVKDAKTAEPQQQETALNPNPTLPGIQEGDTDLTAQLTRAFQKKGPDYEPRTHHLHKDGRPKFVNRLIFETSPYLLQHAHNPVNWWPWGDEAFERARTENKPVLMSIGYSTCHWCHVMERESFEDIEIAAFINEHYIAVKVDREERPDVDSVYMNAVNLFTGRGGWPMTTMLTPDREPFFGGTYFPARDGDRGAQMGFLTILGQLSNAYQTQPDQVVARAKEASRRIRQMAKPQQPDDVPTHSALYQAALGFSQQHDSRFGGFGSAPKFPRPATLDFLLRYYRKTNDAVALSMVTTTLDKMAAGGLYDQIGGGFHRYSTDHRWLVPHFEKMLYDNAQLIPSYLSAWQITKNKEYERIVRETLDYVIREMASRSGAFYSATDADSLTPSGHQEEGWFFTWTPDEVRSHLDESTAQLFEAYYQVSSNGNFEGRTILHAPQTIEQFATQKGLVAAEVRATLQQAKQTLYDQRLLRPPPLRDDKILTAWNGLMMGAFAQAGLILNEPRYTTQAQKAATFLISKLWDESKGLKRSYREGAARHPAVLDDYAFFIAGLIDLYEASGQLQWLEHATILQKAQDEHFWDQEHGGWFLTASGEEQLLAREKPDYDGALPSGNAIATLNVLRLAEFTTDEAYRKRGEQTLQAFSTQLKKRGMAAPALLSALDYYLAEPLEIMVLGPEREGLSELIDVVRRLYLPSRILSITNQEEGEKQVNLIPLLQGKPAAANVPTAFVCVRGTCEQPARDAATLTQQLQTKMGQTVEPPLPPLPRH